MGKKFSLIEMIIVIIVLSVLLSIVLIKWLDLKKESIRVAISQNTNILQSSVDTYYLKNNEFPIENKEYFNLNNPQLVNVTKLQKEGYLKRNLDLSKIKEQYYWVDVFGKVWGSTDREIENVNLYKGENSDTLEFSIGSNIKGYRIYELTSYDYLSSNLINSNSYASKEITLSKAYKEFKYVELKGKGKKVIHLDLPNRDANYLVSVIDEYDLESAPFGKFANNLNDFTPSLNFEGVQEFEVKSSDVMYWLDFKYIVSTPGDSQVSFKFKVKDESENYPTEWTEDFFSLKESKGIIVQVDMKGDTNGNKPSLYDLQVIFKYKDDVEEDFNTSILKPTLNNKVPNATCPSSPISSDLSININKKQKGNVVYVFYNPEGSSLSKSTPKLEFTYGVSYSILSKIHMVSNGNSYVPYEDGMNVQGKCMIVIYNVDIRKDLSEEAIKLQCPDNNSCISFCKVLVNCPEPAAEDSNCKFEEDCSENNNNFICPSNGLLNTINSSKTKTLVYSYYLEDNEKISKLKINSYQGYSISSISLEYLGHSGNYIPVSSPYEIPSGNCIHIIYELVAITDNCSDCESPKVEIMTCKDNCPTFCKVNCMSKDEKCIEDCNEEKEQEKCKERQGKCGPSEKPNTDDPELQDPEWTTVDTLRFFAHGANSQLVRWYGVEIEDDIKDKQNTRIVYRYSKTNSTYWSAEYGDFSTTGIASAVRGSAYIQVRTSAMKEIKEEVYPKVLKMIFENEKGFLNMSLVKPTLIINPVKDNNINREVFSNNSNIEWLYYAADPRNKKIVDIEWSGDIRSKYPVGKYIVKARIKNEVAIWSEWVSFELDVKEEKPMAVITINDNGTPHSTTNFTKDDKLSFSHNDSYDPDGDKIIKQEWIGLKEEFALGKHTVRLRVQDAEGNWSDWTEKTFTINLESFKIYRLEAENFNSQVSKFGSVVLSYAKTYSGGQAIQLSSDVQYLQFTFKGTGFDLQTIVQGSMIYIDDEPAITLNSIFNSFRNLEDKTHVVKVYKLPNSGSTKVDYLDVYSTNDTVEFTHQMNRVISNNQEGYVDMDYFSTDLNQRIKTYFHIHQDGEETIEVLDSNKNTIRSLSKEVVSGGSTYGNRTIVWDGLDDSGQKVSNGYYYISFKYKGVNGTISQYNEKIEVKNPTKQYRLEAENFNSQVSKFGSVVISYAKTYSGGKSVQLSSDVQYLQFTFKGTGFDLQTIGQGSMIYIDDEPAIKLNNLLNSFRDLEDKTHVVKVYKLPNLGLTRVDYIDVY